VPHAGPRPSRSRATPVISRPRSGRRDWPAVKRSADRRNRGSRVRVASRRNARQSDPPAQNDSEASRGFGVREDAPSGTPPGCAGRVGDDHRWFRCAQPPASLWEPSGFGKESRMTRTSTAERPGNLVLVPRPNIPLPLRRDHRVSVRHGQADPFHKVECPLFLPVRFSLAGQETVPDTFSGSPFPGLRTRSPPSSRKRNVAQRRRDAKGFLGASAPQRETVFSSVQRGKRMWGRGVLGNGMGDKGIRNGGGQPASVLFFPFIPLPLPLSIAHQRVRRLQVRILSLICIRLAASVPFSCLMPVYPGAFRMSPSSSGISRQTCSNSGSISPTKRAGSLVQLR
jgi:hypothetical protein